MKGCFVKMKQPFILFKQPFVKILIGLIQREKYNVIMVRRKVSRKGFGKFFILLQDIIKLINN
ncbi:MAG: hypothetical protein LBL74_08270 [Bacteroidales bacterium]|jgi:hypothetical protein|nr:hypothetical protein [Bacteroidales bacterium]